MQKIANTITGQTVLPAVGREYLTYASVSQVVFAEASIVATATAYAAWQAANLTVRPISVTQLIGNDGIPKLLVQYTSEAVTEPLNSVISQVLITSGVVIAPDAIDGGLTSATLIAALEAWKVANPFQKIIRVTQMTGLDGGVGLLVEYGISSTIPNLVNSSILQTFFQDAVGDVNTSYAQYLAWKTVTTNESLKPYRLTYVIASDGSTGVLVEYTTAGVTPGVGQLQLTYIANTALSGGAAGFANNLQGNKTNNPGSQIYRITPIFQGFLIESTLNGNTPVNNLVSQSAHILTTATIGSDAYEAFKVANPAKKPIRLTSMTWGDGSTVLIGEYIS